MTSTINLRQISLGKTCRMAAQIPELCSWCLSSFAEHSGLPRGVAVPDVLLKEAPIPGGFPSPPPVLELRLEQFVPPLQRHREVARI